MANKKSPKKADLTVAKRLLAFGKLPSVEELLDEAYDTKDDVRARKLARQVLEREPNNAEAAELLADRADHPLDALPWWEKAVAWGEEALGGPPYFERHRGEFWHIHETRPYMRSRFELAETVWKLGRREEAVGHLNTLLALCPNDNLGARERLADWLFRLKREAELDALFARYPKGLSPWLWLQALHEFRKHGRSERAEGLLAAARKANPIVLALLLGLVPTPQIEVDLIEVGGASEAVWCAQTQTPLWRSVPGARAWLRARGEVPAPRKKPKAKKPTKTEAAVLALPQVDEVWQVDCRPVGDDLDPMGTPRRIYLLFLADLTHDGLIGMRRGDGWPEAKMAAKTLAAGMRDPASGEPRWPRVLQAPTQRIQEMLEPACAAWGIELRLAPLPAKLVQMYADFKAARSQDDGSLLQIRGMSPNLLERLYQAAAGFYAAAPWLLLPSENAVCVEAPPPAGWGPASPSPWGKAARRRA